MQWQLRRWREEVSYHKLPTLRSEGTPIAVLMFLDVCGLEVGHKLATTSLLAWELPGRNLENPQRMSRFDKNAVEGFEHELAET